jgi:choline dehydrogenase-like flavoprotein
METSDVLIVGSGFGAAAPALRLAEAGWKVTVIEKGPDIDPVRDLRQTQDPRYLLRYLKSLSGDGLGLTYAEGLGGGSPFYEMVSLRAPSLVFDQTDDRGRRVWPAGLDRRVLDPFYERAEAMLRIGQIPAHRIPRSGLVFARLMKELGYSTERARYAVRHCRGTGYCVTGCVVGAKQTLNRTYLEGARRAGAVIHTDLAAVRIEPLDDEVAVPARDRSATHELVCRSTRDGSLHRFRTRILVLAGGTVGTADLLLRSRSRLHHLSRQVGRHVAFNGSVKIAGLLPPHYPDGDMYTGQSHPGVVSYEFLASRGLMVTAGKPLPLQAVAAARLQLDEDGPHAWWGEPQVHLMRRFRRRGMVLAAFGLAPGEGRIDLDGDDLRVELQGNDALSRYKRDTTALLESILERNGGTVLRTTFVNREGRPREGLHFSTSHQVGSCRMADDPHRGVVDAEGRVFGHPGLYVADGAAIPTSLVVNSSLTILANAERIADGILRRESHSPVARAG